MAEGLVSILPPGAVAVERDAPAAEPPALFPSEEALVANAVEGRRREFAEGRACAREALRAIGVPAGAIPADARGAPCWPTGVVGSITHKLRYRAAAVARADQLAGLGIDAEPDEPLPEGVLETIASPRERDHVGALMEQRPGVAWDRLLFSAKEAVVKAAQPLDLGAVGPRGVQVRLAGDSHRFIAAIVPVRDWSMTGAWIAHRGLLLTAASAKRE